MTTTDDARDAIIVGGALAGLAAARTFTDAGKRVGLLEARDARKAEILAALVRAFGPEAAHPSEHVEEDGPTEAWSLGCPVGFLQPGTLSTFAPALRAPSGRVHCAGTETATEWTGYMEGALASAARAASEALHGD